MNKSDLNISCNSHKLRILFLDYDGVVNTLKFKPYTKEQASGVTFRPSYNFPSDGKVNDFDACQWVSKFCRLYDYKIVVTSTWKNYGNFVSCLRDGGLGKDIEILGKTSPAEHRYNEIIDFILHCGIENIENFIIVDDDYIGGPDWIKFRCVKCDTTIGFKFNEFEEAKRIHCLCCHSLSQSVDLTQNREVK